VPCLLVEQGEDDGVLARARAEDEDSHRFRLPDRVVRVEPVGTARAG
jgi:hypothetical protein